MVISSGATVNFKQFYLKRLTRIYPLYLFALLLTLFLLFNVKTPKDTISLEKVFLTSTLIQSWFKDYQLTYNFPAWSLSVEALFYFLFPFIILLFKKLQLKWEISIVLMIWLFTVYVYILMIRNGKFYATYHPVFHLETFSMGVTAGKIFQTTAHVRLFEILSVLSVAIMGYCIFSKNTFFELHYRVGLLAPAFVIFIFTIALSQRRSIRLFKSYRLQYLGEISYGIYILQIPASIFVTGVLDRTVKFSPTISFYIYIAFLLLFSALAYELLEKPCRNMIRKKAIKAGY